MNRIWEDRFRKRLIQFKEKRIEDKNGIPISIKVRVSGGCFHREHSPRAYDLIDNYLRLIKIDESFSLEEHESGPELLVCLALGTAGITLAKSMIDLVTAIIKARSEGIKKGDRPSEPLELIVRSLDEDGKFVEEKILRIPFNQAVSNKKIEKSINKALERMIEK